MYIKYDNLGILGRKDRKSRLAFKSFFLRYQWRAVNVSGLCYVLSVVSDPLRPRGLQAARLLCPWDSLQLHPKQHTVCELEPAPAALNQRNTVTIIHVTVPTLSSLCLKQQTKHSKHGAPQTQTCYMPHEDRTEATAAPTSAWCSGLWEIYRELHLRLHYTSQSTTESFPPGLCLWPMFILD